MVILFRAPVFLLPMCYPSRVSLRTASTLWVTSDRAQDQTERALETLKPPAAGRVEYSDELLPNFFLRVSATGRKSFTFMYRFGGEQRRAELGTFPPLGFVTE